MGMITKSLLSSSLDEIRDSARQTNLQPLHRLSCGGPPSFQSQAIDSLYNHSLLLGRPRSTKIPPSPPFFKGGLEGIYGSRAKKCQETSL
jgi:hypothetical protein